MPSTEEVILNPGTLFYNSNKGSGSSNTECLLYLVFQGLC